MKKNLILNIIIILLSVIIVCGFLYIEDYKTENYCYLILDEKGLVNKCSYSKTKLISRGEIEYILRGGELSFKTIELKR